MVRKIAQDERSKPLENNDVKTKKNYRLRTEFATAY